MIPSEQTCPECGDRFVGSDVHGSPCPNCLGIGAIDKETLRKAAAAMVFDREKGKSK